MTIMSRHPSEEYRNNWDKIFKKKHWRPKKELCGKPLDGVYYGVKWISEDELFSKCNTCKIKVTCKKLKKEKEVCKNVQIIQCDLWISKDWG